MHDMYNKSDTILRSFHKKTDASYFFQKTFEQRVTA